MAALTRDGRGAAARARRSPTTDGRLRRRSRRSCSPSASSGSSPSRGGLPGRGAGGLVVLRPAGRRARDRARPPRSRASSGSKGLRVLDQDYIRTARGKRLPARLVYLRHALPNMLTATLTTRRPAPRRPDRRHRARREHLRLAGPRDDARAVRDRRRTTRPCRRVALVFGTFVLLINFVVDIALGVIDPRSTILEHVSEPPLEPPAARLSGRRSASRRRSALGAIVVLAIFAPPLWSRRGGGASTSRHPRRARALRTRSGTDALGRDILAPRPRRDAAVGLARRPRAGRSAR